jgi:glycosyltransferase involved in cell wall biosynthesis
MKIWLMPSAFHPHRGGVEEATLQLGRFLKAQGHSVLVLTNRHPQDLPAGESVEGLEVRRLAFPAPSANLRSAAGFSVSSMRSLRAMLRIRPRPDVVHVQCASSQLSFAVAYSRLTSVRLVVTTQGEVDVDAAQLYQHSAYARASLRMATRAADALTACSAWTAQSASRVAPRLKNSVVIPNGVDPNQWEVTSISDQPVLATWGRHVPQKGFDLLLDAWPLIRKSIPTARLLIGGSGEQTPLLQSRASSGVEFLGPLDRDGVAGLLTQSRLVVVPSRVEPFGIVALEAMAAGRPVVWSQRGGLNEATGGLGWPVDPYDSSALAQTVVDALAVEIDPYDYRRHAERLSWERQAKRYVRLYEHALTTRAARDSRAEKG